MVIQSSTKTVTTAGDITTDAEKYAKIVRVFRNMTFLKTRDQGNVVVPVRTKTQPSPMKQSASNRHPSQSHTRSTVGSALNHELATARYLLDDLADHVFGHLVSTELARDILRRFIEDGFVQVFKGRGSRYDDHLEPNSEHVQRAIDQAFEDAVLHDCIREEIKNDRGEPESSSTSTKGKGKQTTSKGKGKRKQTPCLFKWPTFPKEHIDEDELVDFLNELTDHAFDFAKPGLTENIQRLNHRFAARGDKHHAMPLSYEPDGEDMRPDFILLPTQAFSADSKTVDPRYLNFTASRLVGEAKNKDLAAGVEQVQRYVRGLRRAQPWVHYVLAMVITKDKAVFMRGEGSGTERLELILSDGRGCIEFIRILLGLALAEDVDLGQNPDVELTNEIRACEVNNVVHHSATSTIPSSVTASRAPGTAYTESLEVSSSGIANSTSQPDDGPISSRTRSGTEESDRHASGASKSLRSSSRIRNALLAGRQPVCSASSASSKRVHSEVGGDGRPERQQKKRKVAETVVTQEERVVFFPLRVYGHKCLGQLFTSGSIRGRGTTVLCVVDISDENVRLALKMSWQDLERVPDHTAVMERLKDKTHPNVIFPIESFNAIRKGQICTTLKAIRGLLDEQINLVQVENRVLNVSTFELKRPVKYFWGVHDFVRGLRGALLGHQFLTSIGILHRDISENNIVLGVFPWEERGYLIDLDMAILQDAEEPTQVSSGDEPQSANQSTPKAVQPDQTKHIKGIRTGTFPYISFSVLLGETHTQFDDVESFLYVLLLFFFSYAGPLSKEDLLDAHENGFVRSIGSGRLPHMRRWPEKFAEWADGKAETIGSLKGFQIANPKGLDYLDAIGEDRDCLNNNWPEDLQSPIRSLLKDIFRVFRESTKDDKTAMRTHVAHSQFVDVLDKWLVDFSGLESQYSNCPDFKDPRDNK